uniref:Uncharacterized protein n=1 Tax=Timema cristinae TaxID=61476 RepID=A0A7R9HEX2_TIMCR|nr:unnamed protein product [Timema cristinae]
MTTSSRREGSRSSHTPVTSSGHTRTGSMTSNRTVWIFPGTFPTQSSAMRNESWRSFLT